MGRLNKKLIKSPKSSKKNNVLSESVLKAVTEAEPTLVKPKEGIPQADIPEGAQKISFTFSEDIQRPKQALRTLKKDGKILKVKKKDRMKMKKKLIREKLAAEDVVKKEVKQKKIREKTVVVGDMKPLVDHLNIIDDLIKEDEILEKKEKAAKPKKMSKGTQKQKKRKNQFMADIALLKEVSKHPQFVQDPFQTITTHIQNKMLMEAEEMG